MNVVVSLERWGGNHETWRTAPLLFRGVSFVWLAVALGDQSHGKEGVAWTVQCPLVDTLSILQTQKWRSVLKCQKQSLRADAVVQLLGGSKSAADLQHPQSSS